MYVNRSLCSEIRLQKTQFHLGPAHREELLGCKGFWWGFGGEGGERDWGFGFLLLFNKGWLPTSQ